MGLWVLWEIDWFNSGTQLTRWLVSSDCLLEDRQICITIFLVPLNSVGLLPCSQSNVLFVVLDYLTFWEWDYSLSPTELSCSTWCLHFSLIGIEVLTPQWPVNLSHLDSTSQLILIPLKINFDHWFPPVVSYLVRLVSRYVWLLIATITQQSGAVWPNCQVWTFPDYPTTSETRRHVPITSRSAALPWPRDLIMWRHVITRAARASSQLGWDSPTCFCGSGVGFVLRFAPPSPWCWVTLFD